MSSSPRGATSPTRREKPSCEVPLFLASEPPVPLLDDRSSPAGGSRRRPAWGGCSVFLFLSPVIFFSGVMMGSMNGGTGCWVSPPVAFESTIHCVSESQVQQRIQRALLEYKNRTADKPTHCISELQVQEKIRVAVRQHEGKQAEAAAAAAKARRDSGRPEALSAKDKQGAKAASRFPQEAQDVFVGMARIPRSDFTTMFNSLGLGVPFSNDSTTNREAFILYRSADTLPRNQSAASEATKQMTIPLLPVNDAMENCDVVSVALISTGNGVDVDGGTRQCLAVVGDEGGGAFHLHRFMRMAQGGNRVDGSPLNSSAPLMLFGRVHDNNGESQIPPPSDRWLKLYQNFLSSYLGNLDQILEKLLPIASAASVNNTIAMMICNYGQSDLLVNFVCGARSRKLDLSSMVVFATDEETLAIAHGLGLHAFHDESAFHFVSKEAADFGGTAFGKIMFLKVICIHMATRLGYDILFQDVDVSWYRNPLDYFLAKERDHEVFDMYIQDDGGGLLPDIPRRSNAGFFFARNNEVTRSFFHDFVMSGAKILQSSNEQMLFNQILNEYSSFYGLRIWTFPDHGEFPSGFVFHRRKEYMKALLAGAMKPYIFHMSWTANKDTKMQFLQQMGDWFVRDVCIQKPLAVNETNLNASRAEKSYKAIIQTCCLRDPYIRCHYRDKPSIVPCKESPAIGLIGDSFW